MNDLIILLKACLRLSSFKRLIVFFFLLYTAAFFYFRASPPPHQFLSIYPPFNRVSRGNNTSFITVSFPTSAPSTTNSTSPPHTTARPTVQIPSCKSPKAIIGIHGLSNKPSKQTYEHWWRLAIIEGISKIKPSIRRLLKKRKYTLQNQTEELRKNSPIFNLEMTYWADYFYQKPLHHDSNFIIDRQFDSEPYVPAKDVEKKKNIPDILKEKAIIVKTKEKESSGKDSGQVREKIEVLTEEQNISIIISHKEKAGKNENRLLEVNETLFKEMTATTGNETNTKTDVQAKTNISNLGENNQTDYKVNGTGMNVKGSRNAKRAAEKDLDEEDEEEGEEDERDEKTAAGRGVVESVKNGVVEMFKSLFEKSVAYEMHHALSERVENWMIGGECLRDLHLVKLYTDDKLMIRTRSGKLSSIKRVLRDELKEVIWRKSSEGRDIMLVAHSMGSIIAYDVLRELEEEEMKGRAMTEEDKKEMEIKWPSKNDKPYLSERQENGKDKEKEGDGDGDGDGDDDEADNKESSDTKEDTKESPNDEKNHINEEAKSSTTQHRVRLSYFVTIGSPLGWPQIRDRIFKEFDASSHNSSSKGIPRVPSNIMKGWINLADKEDTVSTYRQISSLYSPNDRGIQIDDVEISNDYVSPSGEVNKHKSFGYLRTPALAHLFNSFLNISHYGLQFDCHF